VNVGPPPVPTVNSKPLLAIPFTVTSIFPVVAPLGTVTWMLVAPQLVARAFTPLNVTVLVPCEVPKFSPLIVTGVPTGPEFVVNPMMLGPAPTVKATPLLAVPPTVTTIFPVVAPLGTGTVMLVALQLSGVPAVPLKVTVLDPWLAPKPLPMIVMEVPTDPEF
jgi:hypothetical protein